MFRRAALLAFAISVLTTASAHAGRDIDGWVFKAEFDNQYESGVDRAIKHNGSACGYIRGKALDPDGSGVLTQVIKSSNYRARRVRLSAFVRTDGVSGHAGLWMRVEGDDPDRPLSWDNMMNRPIRGTTAWTKRSVVLDVPAAAKRILFGVVQSGRGITWVDDFQLEVVDMNVPVTDLVVNWPHPDKPNNLGFEGPGPKLTPVDKPKNEVDDIPLASPPRARQTAASAENKGATQVR